MDAAASQQHMAWLARSFGRPDYAPLNVDDLRAISGAGELVSAENDAHLFREGGEAVAAYLIQNGSVRLYRGSGRERRVIARVGTGAVLGDIAMFADSRYHSSAQAIGDVTAIRFDRDRLLPELGRHPAICMRWLVAGLNQLEDTQRRVIGLLRKTARGRLAELLLDEVDRTGTVTLSQSSMATLLGITRQTVNEALGDLAAEGAVETGYREVRVVDAQKLAAAADQ
ncbi:MAG: Crp/Fnr family transcriptional regulator [Acidimicrobiia bacterium]|nr:Crp/Fnr family transcriptional regulator [Acidimicrobiia bacterium]